MNIIKTESNCLSINSSLIAKNKYDVTKLYDGVRLSNGSSYFNLKSNETEVDGTVLSTDDLFNFFLLQGFSIGGGSVSDGAVESISGDLVNNTDPANPVINLPTDVIREGDISMTPSAGKVPVFSEQGLLSTGTPLFPENAVPLSYLYSELDGKQNVLEKNQAGGYVGLDNSGKIPLEFLNVSGLQFKGAWNAATNTPPLINGTGVVGEFYKVGTPGSFSFGNEIFDFGEGDWVMFAAGVWQRIGVHENVTSVNGKIGNVVLNKSDVGLVNVDNTSDLNKPISNSTQIALNNKQDALVAGTNIKTLNGQSLMGSGNLDLSTVSEQPISTILENNVTIKEYSNRREYTTKIPISESVSGSGFKTIATSSYLPVGITIDGADEHYISIRNSDRAIKVNVFDTVATGRISIGFFNNWTGSVNVIGSVFIKVIYYK